MIIERRFSRTRVYSSIKWFFVIFLCLQMISGLYQYSEINNDRILLKNDEAALEEIQARIINKGFENIVSDLKYLSQSAIFKRYLNGNENKKYLEEEWMIFAGNKKKYDQIRFINTAGDEKIRINYSNEVATAVAEQELQNKRNRYYFIDTIKLKDGQIYMSKFDLNIENNMLEIPIKPMIRLGLPVFDNKNNKRGVLVLNYLGQYTIDEFEKIARNAQGTAYLVNAEGFWLAGQDTEKEWGFMYQTKESYVFKNQFPREWERMIKEQNGQFYSANGLFTFRTIHPGREVQMLISGKNSGPFQIEACDNLWMVISHVPDSVASYVNDKPIILISMRNLYNNPVLLLGLAIISLITAILLVLYREGNEKIKILATYDVMTGSFNRASGLSILENMLMKNKENITICFIDINGLKEVNDILGHDQGDDLILTAVKAIKDNIRSIDFVIRMGGDEFIICLPDTTVDQAEIIWQRIVKNIEKINDESNKEFYISLSHGISMIKNNYPSKIDEVIKEADIKMYDEKKMIKNVDFSVIKKL